MKLAVMQPYVFPYLGYYQLVAAVDTFVFFDDVNFINKGWINRNRILGPTEPYKFTVPLSKASQNKKINEIELADFSKWKHAFLRQITNTYKKAPFYTETFQSLEQILDHEEYKSISALAEASVRSISELLGINTKFLKSSELDYLSDSTFGGQEKILAICKILAAGTYINPRNGTELYDQSAFDAEKIQLRFIGMEKIEYNQFSQSAFEPGLSVIDVLMFNGGDKTKKLLTHCKLLQKQDII